MVDTFEQIQSQISFKNQMLYTQKVYEIPNYLFIAVN